MNVTDQLKPGLLPARREAVAMTAASTQPRSRSNSRRHGRPSRATVDRAETLSEEIFEEVEAGQRAALKAVKKFVDTVDQTLPHSGDVEAPSKRQDVLDAAMEMADQLVHAQYAFLRKVVRSAGKSLKGPDGGK
jgi:hypothetical protein